VFSSHYPRERLHHKRVLQSFGAPRGLTILPNPGPAVEPPEIKHAHSALMASPTPGMFFVIEWTGGNIDLHEAYF
jgi:hypothetical protein